MVFFLILLLLVIFNGICFSPENEFNTHYLDKKNTAAVNGIFVIMVVFSHYAQYADFGGVYDVPYLALREHLNQMVVATFWFYSGYGMMEAIRKTDGAYVRKLPSKFWKLLFRFDFAVLMFLILNAFFGTFFPVKTFLLALTAWGTVGNSNWYIFAILAEYILMFAAFSITGRGDTQAKRTAGLFLFLLLTIAFVFVLMKAGRPGYTYNTVIILPLGALYSEYRKPLERIIMKSDLSYFIVLAAVIAVYIVSFFKRWSLGIGAYTIWAAAFISAVILITMKASIYNPFLEWFGGHVFSIYILQRLPMMALAHYGCIQNHKYISLIVAFAVTLPLAIAFEKITGRIISIIERPFRPKRV